MTQAKIPTVQCPHCGVPTLSKVYESRPADGAVYRRRQCMKCHKLFISMETAPVGLKMPASTHSRKRNPKPSTGSPPRAPVHKTDHLQALLSGSAPTGLSSSTKKTAGFG